MRVFLSWSGASSREVAEALRDWLPRVIQAVRPWVSAQDIDAGARWSDELTRELEANGFGVLCVNRENMVKPWLLFEAGALSRTVQSARVCPFLVGLRSADLVGPLAQFQAVEADEAHVLKLVASINRAFGEMRLPDDQLEDSFRVWWPNLSAKLDAIRAQSAMSAVAAPRRPVDEMVSEILEMVRSQRRDTDDFEIVERPIRVFDSERTFLVEKLRENNWDITRTAEVIGTPRNNLRRKLAQYQISQDQDGKVTP
jgi:DNA-binding protein Fis